MLTDLLRAPRVLDPALSVHRLFLLYGIRVETRGVHRSSVKRLMWSAQDHLKRHCIEFKYYADGIHSGLTPPG